jgi:bifunctional DNA-binding transcriptional regulator/antitoxin component of YhaV-PrlF toxin-antitoxin module
MTSKRLTVSARGQITIPKAMLKALGARYLECSFDGKNLTLKPMQTRDEFFAELDQVEKNWERDGGGFTVAQMKKMYDL